MTSGRMQNTTAKMMQMEKNKDMKIGKNRAIFLDRDGTINKDTKDSVKNPSGFHFLPGALDALKLIVKGEYKIFVVTNQGPVAKGIYTESDVQVVNRHMVEQLKEHNVPIEGVYYCPHHPNGTVKEYSFICECRKPGTKMILDAAQEFGIDLKKSWMVGDRWRDVQAGQKAGCRTILVKTSFEGDDYYKRNEAVPDYTCNDLLEAVHVIMEEDNKTGDDKGGY